MRIIVSLLFLICFLLEGRSNNIILNDKAATALNKVILYPDSTYTKHSNIYYLEGDLFEVIDQTWFEHEDDAQNQKFRWYKVKASDGKEGWIFGDGLAVMSPLSEIPASLKNIHKQSYQFGTGFEQATIWLAQLRGHDNFHENDYLNPVYEEKYIVVTNENGRSVNINYAGFSAMGRKELRNFYFQDITGDNFPEFILEKSSFPSSSEFENRNLEIYGLFAGTSQKLIDETLTLTYEDDLPSPAKFKCVEIENETVRVEYIDYVPCKQYRMDHSFDARSISQERCLEFVTYTYIWSSKRKHFAKLYDENYSAPKAGVRRDRVAMYDKPTLNAKTVAYINRTDLLKVIKHYEKVIIQNKQKKIQPYLYVQNAAGQSGYITAANVGFIECIQSGILNRYYSNPPLSKLDWRPGFEFVQIETSRTELPTRKIMATSKPEN